MHPAQSWRLKKQRQAEDPSSYPPGFEVVFSEFEYEQPAGAGGIISGTYTLVSSMAISGIRKKTMGLISDYYILRGVFLKSEYDQNHPNFKAFSEAGALGADFGMQLSRADQNAMKLLQRVAEREQRAINASEPSRRSDGNENGTTVWMVDRTEQDLLSETNKTWATNRGILVNLRRRLEAENKGANVLYPYEPAIKYKMIGNQGTETHLAAEEKSAAKESSPKKPSDTTARTSEGSSHKKRAALFQCEMEQPNNENELEAKIPNKKKSRVTGSSSQSAESSNSTNKQMIGGKAKPKGERATKAENEAIRMRMKELEAIIAARKLKESEQ
ncbi:unnamed protein product [Sphagnum balticum]